MMPETRSPVDIARGQIQAAHQVVCALGIRDADPTCRARALEALATALKYLRESDRIMDEDEDRRLFVQWKAERAAQKELSRG